MASSSTRESPSQFLARATYQKAIKENNIHKRIQCLINAFGDWDILLGEKFIYLSATDKNEFIEHLRHTKNQLIEQSPEKKEEKSHPKLAQSMFHINFMLGWALCWKSGRLVKTNEVTQLFMEMDSLWKNKGEEAFDTPVKLLLDMSNYLYTRIEEKVIYYQEICKKLKEEKEPHAIQVFDQWASLIAQLCHILQDRKPFSQRFIISQCLQETCQFLLNSGIKEHHFLANQIYHIAYRHPEFKLAGKELERINSFACYDYKRGIALNNSLALLKYHDNTRQKRISRACDSYLLLKIFLNKDVSMDMKARCANRHSLFYIKSRNKDEQAFFTSVNEIMRFSNLPACPPALLDAAILELISISGLPSKQKEGVIRYYKKVHHAITSEELIIHPWDCNRAKEVLKNVRPVVAAPPRKKINYGSMSSTSSTLEATKSLIDHDGSGEAALDKISRLLLSGRSDNPDSKEALSSNSSSSSSGMSSASTRTHDAAKEEDDEEETELLTFARK